MHNCECIGLRLAQTIDRRIESFCWKCDEYLNGLPVSVLLAIKEGASEAVREGENETREEMKRIERLLHESVFL